jgi:hypothetical protein
MPRQAGIDPMTMTAIRTEGLSKRYGNIGALAGLDLGITAGEVVGYLAAGEYEAVLATHEQAWLFAAGGICCRPVRRSPSRRLRRLTGLRARWCSPCCAMSLAFRSRGGGGATSARRRYHIRTG